MPTPKEEDETQLFTKLLYRRGLNEDQVAVLMPVIEKESKRDHMPINDLVEQFAGLIVGVLMISETQNLDPGEILLTMLLHDYETADKQPGFEAALFLDAIRESMEKHKIDLNRFMTQLLRSVAEAKTAESEPEVASELPPLE